MIHVLIIFILFVVDYKIKEYIENAKEMHKQEEILGGNIILERYHNKGAMLNSLEKAPELVKIISSVILGVILLLFAFLLPRKGNHLLKLALSLILGGAMSNLWDRIKKGYVVDYFSFKWLKKIVFNLSDIFIFLGSAIIFLMSLCKRD